MINHGVEELELSFDTKLDGVFGFIVGVVGTLKSAPFYSTDPVICIFFCI